MLKYTFFPSNEREILSVVLQLRFLHFVPRVSLTSRSQPRDLDFTRNYTVSRGETRLLKNRTTRSASEFLIRLN